MQRDAATGRWVILGFGEAAAALIAAGFLKETPVAVCLATDRPPSAATRRRLESCGLKADTTLVAVSDAAVILSLVTPDAALTVAETIAPFLRPGVLYVDMNSIAGETAAKIAQIVEAAGARYVDAAVMGPVPLMTLRVPIMVSGAAAQEFNTLAAHQGLTTSVLSNRPGDASSLKMLWSVMTKGTIALLAESLTGAYRLGLLEPLMELLAREYGNTGTPALIFRMLQSTAASGGRRLEEMTEVRRTLEAADVPSWTVQATNQWIAALASMPGVAGAQGVHEAVKAVSEGLGEPLGALQKGLA